MTGAGPAAEGPYSCGVNQRPRIGCTPSACGVPSVTMRTLKRVGSPTASVSVEKSFAYCHNPRLANVLFSSRYVRYIVYAELRSSLFMPGALYLTLTSSSAFGYGSGLISTE